MSASPIPGYIFSSCYGTGAFGSVWQALRSDALACAVKVLTPGTFDAGYLASCLERLRAEGGLPGLVTLHEFSIGSGVPYLTMPRMPEGTVTMEQLAGKQHPHEAWALLEALAETLAALHRLDIVHAGLSCGNVFVVPGGGGERSVVVTDAGQAWVMGAPFNRLHNQLAYIPPAHWRSGAPPLRDPGARARDVYAFGVIAWRLLTGSWPRAARAFDATLASVTDDLSLQPRAFADWLENEPVADWPVEAVSETDAMRRLIVERCLSFDPAVQFPDMPAVVAALKDCPFPTGVVRVPAARAGAEDGANRIRLVAPPEKSGEAAASRPVFSRLAPLCRWLAKPAVGGLSLLAAGGLTAYALNQRSGRLTAASDLRAALSANEALSTRLPRAETDAANARSDAEAARTAEEAAISRNSAGLVAKVLATRPADEAELAGWRRALQAVDEHSSPVLEKTPAGAAGMEARWHLAHLKSSLGGDEAALTVLEKLSRDLEAEAIASPGELPAGRGLLTGRVAALTGRIMAGAARTEDALPHLRTATAALEKWIAANPQDTETAALLARNLLLEGQGLTARGQLDDARGALMKIEGLVAKPDAAAFKAEDCFLLADVQFALGRIDALQVPAAPPAAQGSEGDTSPYDPAIARHTDGLKLLIDFDQKNRKSVPCRTRMAAAYYEMGRLLARGSHVRDAGTAYGESVKIYTELIREQPDNVAFTLDLATAYNESAQLMREVSSSRDGVKEALDYQNFGVTVLRNLQGARPSDAKVTRLLASSLQLNGELQEASGALTVALDRYREAALLAAGLLGDSTLAEAGRRECRLVSARAWTGEAGLHDRAKRRSEAAEALKKALVEWEAAVVEAPADQKKMAWVKERLNGGGSGEPAAAEPSADKPEAAAPGAESDSGPAKKPAAARTEDPAKESAPARKPAAKTGSRTPAKSSAKPAAGKTGARNGKPAAARNR